MRADHWQPVFGVVVSGIFRFSYQLSVHMAHVFFPLSPFDRILIYYLFLELI